MTAETSAILYIHEHEVSVKVALQC